MTSNLSDDERRVLLAQYHEREQSAYDGFVGFVGQNCERWETERYSAFLHVLTVALRPNTQQLPDDMLAQIPYYLTDSQREALRRVTDVANRLSDAEMIAQISEEQFHAQRVRVFGTTNPHLFDVPFWTFMVRRGLSAFAARVQFDAAFRAYMDDSRAREATGDGVGDDPPPVARPGDLPSIWCFDRFGMSRTLLPDGRVLYIAGEHEDFYDENFCIYNDVIVLDTNLSVTIYGYPEEAFPPTDFHTANLAGRDTIYIIGSLGYTGSRQFKTTPVYRLDIETMRIEAVATEGLAPGWISAHQADYVVERHALKISGGKISRRNAKGEETYTPNKRVYWLDLTTLRWSAGNSPPPLVAVPQKEGVA